MKKFILVVLVIINCCFIVGCNKKNSDDNVNNNDQSNPSINFGKYKITLDLNGGYGVDNLIIKVNEKDPVSLPAPIKDGFSFVGWALNDEIVNLTKFEYSEDIKLVAKFTGDLIKEGSQTYIYYGKYPQTLVNDVSIINELFNLNMSNSNDYIKYNNKEYYFYNELFYEVELIKWRIYNIDSFSYKLISMCILDNVVFNSIKEEINIDGNLIDSNNYIYSSIRGWLNGYNFEKYSLEDFTNNSFINLSFTKQEQNKLLNINIESNVSDKISLLSSEELNENSVDFGRYPTAQLTDFALNKKPLLQSNYLNNGPWLLRDAAWAFIKNSWGEVIGFRPEVLCKNYLGESSRVSPSGNCGLRPIILLSK